MPRGSRKYRRLLSFKSLGIIRLVLVIWFESFNTPFPSCGRDTSFACACSLAVCTLASRLQEELKTLIFEWALKAYNSIRSQYHLHGHQICDRKQPSAFRFVVCLHILDSTWQWCHLFLLFHLQLQHCFFLLRLECGSLLTN